MVSRFGAAYLLAACVLTPSGPAWASSVYVVPYGASTDVAPPAAVTPLEIPDTLYPLEAIVANEEGKTSLNLLIDAAGRVTLAQLAQSSGSRRLDTQAAGIATKLWRFQPLPADVPPLAREMRIEIDWTLPLKPAGEFSRTAPALIVNGVRARVLMYDDPRKPARLPSAGPRSPCLDQPIVDDSIAPPKSRPGHLQIVEWLHRTENGTVDDMLLQTAKGWMHVSEPLVKAASSSQSVKSVAPPDNGRACWFYAAIAIESR